MRRPSTSTSRFIKAARPGRFIGKGRVVSLGKTIVFPEAELFDEAGDLVARATFSSRAMRGDVATGRLMARQAETPEGRSVRLLRVGEQVRHALCDILMRGDVHDETLASHLVSVTEVRMSPDLRHATAFVIPLLGANAEAVLKALRTNTAYLQSEVARRVNTKYAAKLKFLLDESFDEGSHIDALLRSPVVARDLGDDEV